MSREKFLAAARSFVGYKESDGSHREIIDLYNTISPLPRGYKMGYYDPWCAAFVSAAAKLSGLEDKVLPECSCPAMMEAYKSRGGYTTDVSLVRPGDLVMYDWERDEQIDHVGIVDTVGEKLKVIEGNISDSVGYRLIAPNSKNIRGFCLPAFENKAPLGEQGELSAELTEGFRTQVLLPTLSQGSAGSTVKAAQILLIGLGCRCGPWGADGEFGSATYGAVLRYQQLKNLSPDGIIGPQTWSSLLTAPLCKGSCQRS